MVGEADGLLKVVRNMMSCSWQSKPIGKNTPNSLIRNCCCFIKRGAFANSKQNTMYHCMNELAEDSDEEDEEVRYEKRGFNDDDDDPTDGNNDNCHSQMNVFAM